jgi:2,3-bisphosphoglycerate-dependent phosphoglycerate mutase
VTTIYLVRHAHADWSDDDDRPLSIAGHGAARRLAMVLAAKPITAVYSSPHRRSVQTVAPLADTLGLSIQHVSDLREREVPAVPAHEFLGFMERTWRSPELSLNGAESNVAAQTRGLAALRQIVAASRGTHVAAGTHGNLLTLILNGLDPSFGFEFWRTLSNPDVFSLTFDQDRCVAIKRVWEPLA